MRQKLGVALAVVALTLSGAREVSTQFHQLKSLAGGWANTNVWGSLLVYAADTFDGIAPRRRTALVASNSTSCGGTTQARARRATKSARRAARAKTAAPGLAISELAISHAEPDARRWAVDEFEIEVRREATVKALRPGFVAMVFETEVAREDERAKLNSELSRLLDANFVFRSGPAEAPAHAAAKRRRGEAHRAEEPAADGQAPETVFETPNSSGLLNCDDGPRR